MSGEEIRKRSAWLAGGAGLTAVATIVGALPQSELVIVTGADHLALLDKPDAINDGLVRLVDRVTPSKAARAVVRLRNFRERFRRRG